MHSESEEDMNEDDVYILSDDENYGDYYRTAKLDQEDVVQLYIELMHKEMAETKQVPPTSTQKKAIPTNKNLPPHIQSDNVSKLLSLNIMQQILQFLPPVSAYFACLVCSSWRHMLHKNVVNGGKVHIVNAVAKSGYTECLKYLHQECHFTLNKKTCANAASQGQLECLQYLHKNGVPWNEDTCTKAAEGGHRTCLKYAHKNGCPWNEDTCCQAALHGKLSCLQYAYQRGCKWLPKQVCASAALGGHLDVLQYAREKGEWDCHTTNNAAKSGSLACLKYAHENGCPWAPNDDIIMHEGFIGNATDFAAEGGHLECLKYAVENGCYPGNDVVSNAVKNSHLNCLQYALANGHYETNSDEGFEVEEAARQGNLEIVKLLHAHGFTLNYAAPAAIKAGQFECLEWMVENGCEWGDDWDDQDEYDTKCLVYALENGCRAFHHLLWQFKEPVEEHLKSQGVELTPQDKQDLREIIHEKNEMKRMKKALTVGESSVLSTLKMQLYKLLMRARKDLNDICTLHSIGIEGLCCFMPTTPAEIRAIFGPLPDGNEADIFCNILLPIITNFMAQNNIVKSLDGSFMVNGKVESSWISHLDLAISSFEFSQHHIVPLYNKLLSERSKLLKIYHNGERLDEHAVLLSAQVKDLCKYMPTTENELSLVIGEDKAKLYGNTLLPIIQVFRQNLINDIAATRKRIGNFHNKRKQPDEEQQFMNKNEGELNKAADESKRTKRE